MMDIQLSAILEIDETIALVLKPLFDCTRLPCLVALDHIINDTCGRQPTKRIHIGMRQLLYHLADTPLARIDRIFTCDHSQALTLAKIASTKGRVMNIYSSAIIH